MVKLYYLLCSNSLNITFILTLNWYCYCECGFKNNNTLCSGCFGISFDDFWQIYLNAPTIMLAEKMADHIQGLPLLPPEKDITWYGQAPYKNKLSVNRFDSMFDDKEFAYV